MIGWVRFLSCMVFNGVNVRLVCIVVGRMVLLKMICGLLVILVSRVVTLMVVL